MTYETKDAAYDAEILPLMNQVYELCLKHEINNVCLFQLDSSEDSTDYRSQQVLHGELERTMLAAALVREADERILSAFINLVMATTVTQETMQ